MADPTVTVVVTCHNRSELLPVALRSVQMQDFADWECIVVDDASTDDSVDAALQFSAADKRFRVIRHTQNLGLSAARNTGIFHARAPMVCFLDDDDFLLSGSLRHRAEKLAAAPAGVVGSFCDWLNTDPEVGLEIFHQRLKPQQRGVISLSNMAAGAPFIATAPLLRSSVVRRVGGFDEALRRAEDADLWARLGRLGYIFTDASIVGVAYRRSPQSMVHADPAAQLRQLDELYRSEHHAAIATEMSGPLPISEPMSSLAWDEALKPQYLRYCAMTAVHDVEQAIELGVTLLGPCSRLGVANERVAKELLSYVAARFVLDGQAITDAATSIEGMLSGLEPADWHAWSEEKWSEEKWSEAAHTAHFEQRGQEFSHPVERLAGDEARQRAEGAVLLVVEAAYHVDEFGPLHDELQSRGIRTEFMLSPKTVPSAVEQIAAFTDRVIEYDIESAELAAGLCVLNDWGPLRDAIERLNERGVPTFAKVEGVQDFDDVDTGWERSPYRQAAIVFGQGENDVSALPDKRVEVVGSSRLERIWKAPPSRGVGPVLVNLNFTYHVLTEYRDSWLASVSNAIKASGNEGVVSRHPAERGEVQGLAIARKPFRHEILRASALVSRFSTVPFEALARGVPFVYHNPHGEQVPTFTNPLGAFAVTSDERGLTHALRELADIEPNEVRSIAATFFERQVSIEPERTSAQRTADVIESIVQGA